MEKKTKVIIGIVAAVVVIGGGIGAYMFLKKGKKDEKGGKGGKEKEPVKEPVKGKTE